MFHDFSETFEANSNTVVLSVSVNSLLSLSFIVFLSFCLHYTVFEVDTTQVNVLQAGHIKRLVCTVIDNPTSCEI
jgi:hypothetical protein